MAARNSYALNAPAPSLPRSWRRRPHSSPRCSTRQPSGSRLGHLTAVQLRVEHFFDPVPIPVIGYVDMAFDGVDVDLKSTKAIPSAPRFRSRAAS